jgi:hypothetical protein
MGWPRDSRKEENLQLFNPRKENDEVLQGLLTQCYLPFAAFSDPSQDPILLQNTCGGSQRCYGSG